MNEVRDIFRQKRERKKQVDCLSSFSFLREKGGIELEPTDVCIIYGVI